MGWTLDSSIKNDLTFEIVTKLEGVFFKYFYQVTELAKIIFAN
jgi:hypothetical protein